MACHLHECVLDYGPLNHFWLFAFERFNGILGLLPNNNKSIEIQMTKRFLNDQKVMWLSFPDEFQQDFETSFEKHVCGTLAFDFSLTDCEADMSDFSLTSSSHTIVLPKNYFRSLFSSTYIKVCMKSYILLHLHLKLKHMQAIVDT